jgi:hypothetical protein
MSHTLKRSFDSYIFTKSTNEINDLCTEIRVYVLFSAR